MDKHSHSAENWDILWSEAFSRHIILYNLWYHYLWRAYGRLLRHIKLNAESRVLELGCGSGRISLYMAQKYGCRITLVDSSAAAIRQSASLFGSHNIQAEHVHSDLFAFDCKEEFDLVHSEGLIEHFQEVRRQEALFVHKDAARQLGYVITFIPYGSLIYRFTSWLMKLTNNWYFGYEVPLELSEHITLHKETGLTVIAHTSVLSRELGLLSQRS